MRTNPNVVLKFRKLLDILSSVPEVTANEYAPLSAQLEIADHPPLKSVQLRYHYKNRFWTKDYDPIFLCEVSLSSPLSGTIRRIYRRGSECWVESSPSLASLAARLNRNSLLTRSLNQVTLQKAELSFSGDKAEITLIPMSGITTRMLFPPLTHFTPPFADEYLGLLQGMQLLSAELQRSDT